MRLALINPGIGFQQPPLSLAYLASYLNQYYKKGLEIKIFDEASGDNILKKCKKFCPDIAGFTITTPMLNRAKSIATSLKQQNPNIKLFAGGPHVTALPETITRHFDLGFMGESEQTLLEVINLLSEKKEIRSSSVKGICYQKDGKTITTERRDFIQNLDDIPHPARDLLNMKHYTKPKETLRGIIGKATQVMASRGCNWDCHYCSNNLLWQRRVRYHSPEYIMSEIKDIVRKYNLDLIYFQDDNFTSNHIWLNQLCNLLIKSKLSKRISWVAQARVDCITREELRLMKKAGCIRVEFGLESANEKILESLNKKTNLETAKKVIRMCREEGLQTLGNFMIGSPIETEENIMETRHFYRENRLTYTSVHILSPLPGTKLFWDYIKDQGLSLEDLKWDTFYAGIHHDDISISKYVDSVRLHELHSEILRETAVLNGEPFNCYRNRSLKSDLQYLKYKLKRKVKQAIQI